MAMSMDELQIFVSEILVVVIYMMDFEQTVGGEVPAAVDAFSALPFEEFGDARGHERIAAHAGSPIGPLAVERTPPFFHLGVTHDRVVLMAYEPHAGRGLKTPCCSPVVAEVFPLYPSFALVRMTEGRPLPELVMDLVVRFAEGFFGHACPIILPPAANDRVERFNHGFLCDAAQFFGGSP